LHTDAVQAHAAGAIPGDAAALSIDAARAVGPAAIDVGLVGIEQSVAAPRVRGADAVLAEPAEAVARDQARLADGAGEAGAAAVHVGLRAVLHPVAAARRQRADAVHAQRARAVGADGTMAPVGAFRALRAAAIDVGLGAVLDAVVAHGDL